jgi:hypothetical protein
MRATIMTQFSCQKPTVKHSPPDVSSAEPASFIVQFAEPRLSEFCFKR